MLQSLHINNVVLIDELDLDFAQGFGVLTGETGAGKSILLDSLGLVLGRRAETSLIRKGADKLSVTATFTNIDNPELMALLSENELEQSPEIMIKRTLNTSGVGKIFFNDQPISAKLLKEIGKYLVEIHGQFDNQGLLNPTNHRSILDAFGGLDKQVNACKDAYKAYQAAKKKRAEFENNIAKAKEDEENLIHWVKELEQVAPRSGEMDELQARRQELMHAEKIIENLNYAYSSLQSADVASALRSAQAGIDKANNLVNDKYASIYEALDAALVQVNEAIEEIENASADISLNANEQESIDSRIFALKDLARKHGCDVDALPDVLLAFKEKLNAITLGEDGLSELRSEEQQKRLAYIEAANLLHQSRVAAAQKLDAHVMSELPPLKMEKAKFITEIKSQDEAHWSENGADEVDVVINIGKAKEHDYKYIENEVAGVVAYASGATVKVIIETCYLSDEEKVEVCKACTRAKANFVKTSTGFGTGGAKKEDVRLMKNSISENMEVKASGGIHSAEDVLDMVEAGATRIGASASVKIMESAKEE